MVEHLGVTEPLDAGDVVAALPLKLLRTLYHRRRMPEWLYKLALMTMPRSWYPEPQLYILRKCFDDHEIELVHRTNDTIGREAWLFGYYDRLVLKFLREIAAGLKGTATHPIAYYDIGANVGNHAAYLADLFDQVYCFEPNPEALELLRVNLAPFRHAEIFPIGLSNRDAELNLAPGGANNLGAAHIVTTHGREAAVRQIAVRNGDQLVAESTLVPPMVMKIDVEGHEPEVIAGLEQTIRRHAPVIAIEIWERTLGRVAPLRDLLGSVGYRSFRMTGLSRVRQLASFQNRLVVTPYAFDTPCENALAVPPQYWDSLQHLLGDSPAGADN